MIIVSYDYSIHLCIYICILCSPRMRWRRVFFSPFFLSLQSQNTICTPMESQTPPLSSASNEQTTKEELNIQFQTPKSSSSSPFSAVVNIRLWRPAAQRNLRNQWSKLASLWQDWQSCSSATRSQATTLVNSYLSQKYSKKPTFINILNNIQKIFY